MCYATIYRNQRSLLLSDNGFLLSNKTLDDYDGQSMLKFLNPKELDEMSDVLVAKN